MGYKFHRRDSNHEEVIGWYEELYCSVLDLHAVGFGCPDLAVGYGHTLIDLVEVKTTDGHLLPSQVTFRAHWRGAPIIVVRTHADVVNHYRNLQERARGSFGRTHR